MNESDRFEQQLAQFTPYLQQKITLPLGVFAEMEGRVQQFVDALRETYRTLNACEPHYQPFYAEKLFAQFQQLKSGVARLKKTQGAPRYQSRFRFPDNVHQLPPRKRLYYYQQALRELNDKLDWISQQLQQPPEQFSSAERQALIASLAQTEQRKQKCQQAIDALNCG